MSDKKAAWQKRILVGKDADGITVYLDIALTLEAKTDPNKRTTNLEPAPSFYTTLSICGDGKARGQQDYAYFGQIQDTIRSQLDDMELDIDREKLLRILFIWNSYHLNDMTAGSEKQEEVIKKHYEKNKRRYRYEDALTVLTRAGLLVDRGYRYGTQWLLRILPDEIKKEVKSW